MFCCVCIDRDFRYNGSSLFFDHAIFFFFVNYVTMMWGADMSTANVATMVNRVKVIRHSLSKTIAANFQSFSMAAVSSSSRILSVITRISFSIRLSSLWTPGGKAAEAVAGGVEVVVVAPTAFSSTAKSAVELPRPEVTLMNPPGPALLTAFGGGGGGGATPGGSG